MDLHAVFRFIKRLGNLSRFKQIKEPLLCRIIFSHPQRQAFIVHEIHEFFFCRRPEIFQGKQIALSAGKKFIKQLAQNLISVCGRSGDLLLRFFNRFLDLGLGLNRFLLRVCFFFQWNPA
jgi:hypothetical protein